MKPVVDLGGYQAQRREFRVARVNATSIRMMQERKAPLGFVSRRWERCLRELEDALTTSGLDDADVRIRGSATEFFSGVHKPFPKTEGDLLGQATERSLSDDDLRQHWQRFGYNRIGPLPNFHYFDSRLRLGLIDTPSDYDFQVSSDRLAVAMDAYGRQYNLDDLISSHGGHFKHMYVVSVFPALGEWAEKWTGDSRREVNIASFSGGGPVGASRFRAEDWIIRLPAKG